MQYSYSYMRLNTSPIYSLIIDKQDLSIIGDSFSSSLSGYRITKKFFKCIYK